MKWREALPRLRECGLWAACALGEAGWPREEEANLYRENG